ncbi:MAG: hypothetical protein MI741_18495 [Rhodospirillales bacterium]|nr:hypothetical protein [Rhodospirillales bacterium]
MVLTIGIILLLFALSIPSCVMFLAALDDQPDFFDDDGIPPWISEAGVEGKVIDLKWMDNHRLLIARGSSDRPDGHKGSPSDFLIWEDGKGASVAGKSISPELELSVNIDLCYDSGNVYYTAERIDPPKELERDLRFPEFSGPFGKEKPYKYNWGLDKPTIFNRLICKDSAIPDSAIGRTVTPLRPGHGVISEKSRGVDGIYYDFHWHADDGSNRVIELTSEEHGRPEFAAAEVDHYRLKFAPFENAYFVASRKTHGNCRQAWWIRPGPVLEETCLFEGWVRQKHTPTKVGFLWAGTAHSYDPDAFYPYIKTDGLYLTHKKSFLKIVGGTVGSYDVSPDGCRVAFKHYWGKQASPFSENWPPGVLKIVDLCANLAHFPEVKMMMKEEPNLDADTK